jgi:hypothetical protein
MNGRSLRFWLWPICTAVGIAASIGLDILLIASGVVPAVPGLLAIFVFPAVAGLVVGVGNRRAGVAELLLMALLSAAAVYALLVAISILGIATSSNVSCSEPEAPFNCDNDIGSGVGLFIGLPIAAMFLVLTWLGSTLGVAIRRRFQLRMSSRAVGTSGDNST